MFIRALRLTLILCWGGLIETIHTPKNSRRKATRSKRSRGKENTEAYTSSLQVG